MNRDNSLEQAKQAHWKVQRLEEDVKEAKKERQKAFKRSLSTGVKGVDLATELGISNSWVGRISRGQG